MPSSQEERRISEEEEYVQKRTDTNLTVPVPTWQARAPRPKSSPSSSAQNLPQIHIHIPTHTHSRSDGDIPPQTHSRPGSATEPSWQPEPPRSLWERPRFLAEDGERDRGVRFEDGGGERKSKEDIEREREVRRRSIRVDSYDDRPKRDEEGCCRCLVM